MLVIPKLADIQLPIWKLMLVAVVLRVGFFFFGLYQDEYMDVKYTDIDYLVFSDAANYVYQGASPYERATYRYTPLLAWLLVPNWWFEWSYSWGKFLFILSDLITGYIIIKLLQRFGVKGLKLTALSSIWLLNPMVITISTRGSSESVLTVLIMLSIYFLINGQFVLGGVFAGLSIHFKIYPIIYLTTFILYLDKGKPVWDLPVVRFVTYQRISYGLVVVMTMASLNLVMYHLYGYEFLYESYLYHLERIDHRHNFSVYNISLYFKSALPHMAHDLTALEIEKYAFIPQLLLSGLILPFVFKGYNVVSVLFLQTFTFVAFNKVITSQYFIWFLIFLPMYLKDSELITIHKSRGIICLLEWVLAQALWLYNAYRLEFLGQSTFYYQLLLSSCFFFVVNIHLLGVFIDDLNKTKTKI